MIPKLYHKIWEQGVNTGDYVLKLCGAGGGGVILGFTRDFKQAKKHFKGHKLRVVSYF